MQGTAHLRCDPVVDRGPQNPYASRSVPGGTIGTRVARPADPGNGPLPLNQSAVPSAQGGVSASCLARARYFGPITLKRPTSTRSPIAALTRQTKYSSDARRRPALRSERCARTTDGGGRAVGRQPVRRHVATRSNTYSPRLHRSGALTREDRRRLFRPCPSRAESGACCVSAGAASTSRTVVTPPMERKSL